MKPTNATLNALLASRQFYAVDLYTITLVGGTVLRYCQGQTDISYGGHTFSAGGTTGPYFDRSGSQARVNWKTGFGTDSLVIEILPGTATILGVPMLTAVRTGVFDGATFQLDRAFMTTYGDTAAGLVLMFLGRVAEVDADRSLVVMTVNDFREMLEQSFPRNLFQAGCVNTLYDTSCAVVRATFSFSATVQPGTTVTSLKTSLSQATGYFDLGKIVFTSGALNGIAVGISSWVAGSPGSITPVVPFPSLPAVGDSFTASAGCDRSLGQNGCLKFNNVANFRGFPYTPAPETAL